jgi:hypothetical protein
MRSAGNFNSEWGYLAPVPSFMRTVRVVLVATAIGATAGAAVVLSLIDRPTTAEQDRTASITAHAIVTSAQAAPAAAAPAPSSRTAGLAAPVGVTTAVPATGAATAQAPSQAPGAPPIQALGATQITPPVAPAPPAPQMAMQPPPVATLPTVAAPQGVSTTTTPAVPPQAAIERQPSSTPPQASVAIDSSASENGASGGGAPSAPKPASGFASLTDVPSATGTAPAETTDQALIPPQTVPVKKPRPHAAYASNKYQPTPGLGTVLRHLFSPHHGTSYYPNR